MGWASFERKAIQNIKFRYAVSIPHNSAPSLSEHKSTRFKVSHEGFPQEGTLKIGSEKISEGFKGKPLQLTIRADFNTTKGDSAIGEPLYSATYWQHDEFWCIADLGSEYQKSVPFDKTEPNLVPT